MNIGSKTVEGNDSEWAEKWLKWISNTFILFLLWFLLRLQILRPALEQHLYTITVAPDCVFFVISVYHDASGVARQANQKGKANIHKQANQGRDRIRHKSKSKVKLKYLDTEQ